MYGPSEEEDDDIEQAYLKMIQNFRNDKNYEGKHLLRFSTVISRERWYYLLNTNNISIAWNLYTVRREFFYTQ